MTFRSLFSTGVVSCCTIAWGGAPLANAQAADEPAFVCPLSGAPSSRFAQSDPPVESIEPAETGDSGDFDYPCLKSAAASINKPNAEAGNDHNAREDRSAREDRDERDDGEPAGEGRMPESEDESRDRPVEAGLQADPVVDPAEADAAKRPRPEATTLDPQLLPLRDKVRNALNTYYPRHLNTRDHSNWEVMHGIIAYGVDTQLFRGGPSGPKVNGIGWMCFNGQCHGEQMLYLNKGHLVARRGPGLQGHYGQFLAILAQSHVKIDYPMTVGGRDFTIRDLVEHEKQDCQAGEELTFKLIALMHYLDSDETWLSRDGHEWSIQKLIQEELKQPIRGAACGGTHRLMGFSYAVNKRIKRGQSVTGQFKRAQIFVQDYHRYTMSLQNSDGSFSTEWFTRRGARPDIDRRLKTTGHILEWLSFSLSDQELRDPRIIKAVDYVSGILIENPRHAWEIGPLGHGLHALSVYESRMFPRSPGERLETLARRDGNTAK